MLVHLRRRLRRHVPHGPLPRINSLDPLSALTTVSLRLFCSSLHHTRSYPPPFPPSPHSPPPLLPCPLRPAGSLARTSSSTSSLFYATSSSSEFLPCVSLSLRTHLPAERGRTCSTVALRPDEPTNRSSTTKIAPDLPSRSSEKYLHSRGTLVLYPITVVFFYVTIRISSFVVSFVCVSSSSSTCVRTIGKAPVRERIETSYGPIPRIEKSWHGSRGRRELEASLAYFRSQVPAIEPPLLPLRCPPSSFTSHGCASRYSEIARWVAVMN